MSQVDKLQLQLIHNSTSAYESSQDRIHAKVYSLDMGVANMAVCKALSRGFRRDRLGSI